MTRGLPCMSLRDAEGAGVLAVGGAEGVVDIDVAELGELAGEVGIVLFFCLCGSGDFPAGALRRLSEPLASLSTSGPMQSSANSTSLPSNSLKPRQRRASANTLASGPPLGRPRWDMRIRRPPRSMMLLIVGQRLHDPAIVGDAVAVQRDVEIDPHRALFSPSHRRRQRISLAWIGILRVNWKNSTGCQDDLHDGFGFFSCRDRRLNSLARTR